MRLRTASTIVCGLCAIGLYASERSAPDTADAVRDAARERVRLPADGVVRGDRPIEVELPAAGPREAHSITVVLRSPDHAKFETRVPVSVRRGSEKLSQKWLHNGDPDLFVLVRGGADDRVVLEIGDAGAAAPFEAVVRTVEFAAEPGSNRSGGRTSAVVIETEPNDRPEDANEFELGQTVFASADDRPYIAAPGEDEAAAKPAGEDWYKFTFTGPAPRLAFLSLDFIDREVPVDLAIFTMTRGKLEPYEPGFEKFEPEKTTRFAGMFKFVARRVEPGVTYFLRVRANHPAYQLRSETQPLPPFDPNQVGGTRAAAEQSVRTDHLVSDAMSDDAATVRQLALDLVRRSRDLRSNASVRVALAELLKDPNERTRQIAESLYSGKQLPRDDVDVAKLLDFDFFKVKVQPIFFAPGPTRRPACSAITITAS